MSYKSIAFLTFISHATFVLGGIIADPSNESHDIKAVEEKSSAYCFEENMQASVDMAKLKRIVEICTYRMLVNTIRTFTETNQRSYLLSGTCTQPSSTYPKNQLLVPCGTYHIKESRYYQLPKTYGIAFSYPRGRLSMTVQPFQNTTPMARGITYTLPLYSFPKLYFKTNGNPQENSVPTELRLWVPQRLGLVRLLNVDQTDMTLGVLDTSFYTQCIKEKLPWVEVRKIEGDSGYAVDPVPEKWRCSIM